jgi:hypothetical protein
MYRGVRRATKEQTFPRVKTWIRTFFGNDERLSHYLEAKMTYI